MTSAISVIDLFAGPGGLAEGFASVADRSGKPIFDIVLSVEKERSAHKTLLLRSFVRKFPDGLPPGYDDYACGKISLEELREAHPEEWREAEREAQCLELGTAAAASVVDPVIDDLRASGSENCVLVGGPPCQAYSLAGRSRNRGVKGYVPEADERHFLYREYIRILRRLEPAVFVMENVKGMLSASVQGKSIFSQVLVDLRDSAAKFGGYQLIPLSPSAKDSEDFLIRSEDFGVPQARHRVVIFGVRQDIVDAARLSGSRGLLEVTANPASVLSVIGGLPKLRCGLSKRPDSEGEWRESMLQALDFAIKACLSGGSVLSSTAAHLAAVKEKMGVSNEVLKRSSTALPEPLDGNIDSWFARDGLSVLTDHETRGHMSEDLARYAFVSAFGAVEGRSPSSREFPTALAPRHASWSSGKFADRFKVQVGERPASTITSHIAKDGHYFIHPDCSQCRSLTVREAARLQTFPDNYLFQGSRTQKYTQVGNAVPPLLARQIGEVTAAILGSRAVRGSVFSFDNSEGGRRPYHPFAAEKKGVNEDAI